MAYPDISIAPHVPIWPSLSGLWRRAGVEPASGLLFDDASPNVIPVHTAVAILNC